MTHDRWALANHWLVLAAAALGISGVLALGVAVARVPIMARYLTDTDVARRVLIVHVGLGVVAWFSALSVALFHFYRLTESRSVRASRAAALAPWLSSAGATLLLGGLLPGLGTAHPVNYIPLVEHSLYAIGLVFFFAGVTLGISKGPPSFARSRPRTYRPCPARRASSSVLPGWGDTTAGHPSALPRSIRSLGPLRARIEAPVLAPGIYCRL